MCDQSTTYGLQSVIGQPCPGSVVTSAEISTLQTCPMRLSESARTRADHVPQLEELKSCSGGLTCPTHAAEELGISRAASMHVEHHQECGTFL